MTVRNAGRVSTLAIVAATSGYCLHAYAQTPASPAQQAAQSAAPAGAASPRTAAADEATLQEITVTARYQTENLQQTPISITALTAEDMEKKGIQNLTDISKEVPNLKLDPNQGAFGNSASVFIRGIGQSDFDFAYDPGVGIYMDGVYFGTLYGDQMDLSDTASVQVLRGPQGTLFGRSTEGGAILINTVQPKGDDSGYAEVGYGSYNHEQFKGAFDVPIIKDRLALRVAVGVNNVDGYVDVLDFACAHPKQAAALNAEYSGVSGYTPLVATTTSPGCKTGELGGSDTGNYHGSLLWTPNNDLRVLLTGDLLDIRGEESASVVTYIDPNFPGSYGWLAPGYSKIFLPSNHYSSYQLFSNPLNGLSYPNTNNTFSWGFSGTVDYDTPWGIHLKNILAYRKYDAEFSDWLDGSPIPIDISYNELDHHQFSEELQISGKLFDDALDWTAGAYYYTAFSNYYAIADAPPFGDLLFTANDPVIDHNTSGFVHGVYHVTDAFSVETGVRYSTEDKSYTFYRADPYTGGPAPSLGGFPVHYGPFTAASSRFDPKVEFQYQFTPDVMGYASVSTGFKGGGINARPSATDQVEAFKPEDLTAYELGAKTQWFNNRLRFNADIFGEDYKDLQTTFVPPGSAGSVTVNTGHVLIYGTELELDATPIPGLQIDSSAGWLHNRTLRLGAAGECPDGYIPPILPAVPSVTELENATCQMNGLQPGQKLPGIPSWKLHAGIQYAYELPDGIGTLTPRLDWNYQSTVYYGTQSSRQQIQPGGAGTPLVSVAYPVIGRQAGYSTVDARLAFDSPDGNWTAAFEVHNLTNEFYYINGFSSLGSEGHIDETPSLPRTYFFTLKRYFQAAAPAAPYTPPPVEPVAAPAPVAPPPARPERQREFQVFFDFGRSDITPAAANVIRAAADVVEAGGVAHIEVTGHTDTVGADAYNQMLSERRAAAVRRQLVADGVDGSAVTTRGVGKSDLLVPTGDGTREPQNRRAVIELR